MHLRDKQVCFLIFKHGLYFKIAFLNEVFISSCVLGIAVASALVTLGNSNRKISMDSTVKTDLKGKSRKCAVSNQNTDNTCI